MKATKEQIDGELMVIKLFASNYARDLLIPGKCKPILWEELSWTDIEQITKTFKMGVLPIGTSEQYGPHLLRGVDTIHCMR
jgi:hypothetical protein